MAKRRSAREAASPRSIHRRTEQIIARLEKKVQALYREYTVPCPHCGWPILASVFASAAAQRASAMRARRGAGTGRPKKLSPCPQCGEMFGVAEMRRHRAVCPQRRRAATEE